ncbi:hypothetical protein GCM10010182_18110 [Actinomadura cremea]|nr:hypothetical protein GCM10010182_18110 [Actinomadura cremea]
MGADGVHETHYGPNRANLSLPAVSALFTAFFLFVEGGPWGPARSNASGRTCPSRDSDRFARAGEAPRPRG